MSEQLLAANVRTLPQEGVAWAFPFADMVSVAASFFEASRPDRLEFQRVYAGNSRHDVVETATPLEGPRFWVRIAPGNVQVFRRDQARAEKTRARLSEERGKAILMDEAIARADEREWRDVPMAWRDPRLVPVAGDDRDPADGVGAGLVGRWSTKSQRRLVQTIGRLDLAPIVGGVEPPALVTLTLPGDWRAVCPDPATGVVLLKRLERRWWRKWRRQLRCIWKREFQGRGAPHWHLWLCPPAPMEDFAPWLSNAWTDCLAIDTSTDHGRQEDRNSRAAGTGVDYSRAADMRDPRRLAVYFLKETLGGEEKQYQNDPPEGWATDSGSVGRYWGTKGLEQVVCDVPLSTDDGVRVWRALRRRRGLEPVARRKLRCAREHQHSRRCYRLQRRRAVAPPAAGWVAANDGPGLAIMLSRIVESPAEGRLGWPPPGPSLARQLRDARGA